MPFPHTDTGLAEQGYEFEGKGKCKACQADIEWWRTPKQKHIPLNAGTLEPHWHTCPQVDQRTRAANARARSIQRGKDWR